MIYHLNYKITLVYIQAKVVHLVLIINLNLVSKFKILNPIQHCKMILLNKEQINQKFNKYNPLKINNKINNNLHFKNN